MKKFYHILHDTMLFKNFTDTELDAILYCLNARKESYKKGEAVFLAGDLPKEIGVVCAGSVKIIREDFDGNTNLLRQANVGDIFAEAFVCAGLKEIPVSVWAAEKTEIIFLDYKRVLTTCSSCCDFHTRLIENMLSLMAHKLLQVNKKMEIITKPTTREKFLAYIEPFAKQSKGASFTIPLNRQQLADYLGVNRSALSREMSNMKDEGIIDFSGNIFIIK